MAESRRTKKNSKTKKLRIFLVFPLGLHYLCSRFEKSIVKFIL